MTAARLSPRRQVFAANYRGDKQAAEDTLNAAYASPDFHTEETSLPPGHPDRGVYGKYGFQDPGPVHGTLSGHGLSPHRRGGAGPSAAQPGGGQRPRYRILARLGAEEKMRRRSVFTQVFLAFFLPWPWRWSMPQWA